MKRKFLISLLSVLSAFCLTFGFAACEKDNGKGSTDGGKNKPGGPPSLVLPGDDADTLLAYETKTEILTDENGEPVKDEEGNNVIDKYVVITGIGTETKTAITIPATVDEKPVKKIAVDAFRGKTDITAVSFSEGLEEIGNGAFTNCSSITALTFPNSLTTVGTNAFLNCAALSAVNIGSGLKVISDSMFQNCTSLTSITVPANVTAINENAFFSCTSLRNVEVGSGVTTIGPYAFKSCTSLKVLDMTGATSLATLGNNVFQGAGLEKIIFPNSVRYIGTNLLTGCYSIDYISVPFLGRERLMEPYGDNDDEKPNYTHFSYLFGAAGPEDNNSKLGELNGKSITVRVTDVTDEAPICYGAFWNTKGIGTIIIEGTMTKLRTGALYSASLEQEINVVLPESIEVIDINASGGTRFKALYFMGNQEMWLSSVTIRSENMITKSLTTYYYSEKAEAGCWHYVDGKPTVWNN